ncbi:hypothetical protein DFH07DRAFT_859911 [Mycena maculata]|uniref:Uncharacterized protein n=1 Tax=Mycena maculata TaxID=230809 RepID=A0AAD7MIW4_9AGAR|nr:hypothetical protein DFH07DRAFT_859911 [Mycena maculata]
MTTPTKQVTLHILSAGCTEDFSGWPSAILSIYSTLGLPLPAWCATGPHFLPPNEQPRLAGVFNLVVSAVTDIQSLVALYGPSRSAAPFVLPLLRILARICAQEAMIITEAPFVRPRTKTPDSDDFDGVATMLACHVLEGDVPLPSSEDSTTLASETAYPGASSDTESDPSPSFNGPLGAHILPGRGVHAYAALPFLCVADQDNIADLMASVACQRHIWGVPDPAVGFVLSGPVMRLVLSWLDPATFTVHIASGASNGVFYLTNTTSALSLAHFILNLSPHFASILEHAKERSKLGFENNRLDWRSDGILPSRGSGDWRDRVVQWLRHVEIPPSPLSLPTTSPSTEMARDKSSKTSDQSEAKSEAQSETPKRQSSSAFAARTIGSLGDEEGQLLTWMFDRSVQAIARIRFIPAKGEQQEDINRKIDLYDKMCGLQRLDVKVALPLVDGTVSAARKELISQLPQPTADPNEDLPVLTASQQAILFGRLSAMLFAASGAYIMDHQREDVPVYEAESRYHWDSLLYHFYCQETDTISPYVMLEHMIHYPRNDLADKMHLAASIDPSASKDGAQMKVIDTQAKRMRNNGTLCYVASQTAAFEGLLPEVLELAEAATRQANQMSAMVGDWKRKPAQFQEAVNTRSNVEPAQGKCDAILFMSIPNKSGLSKDLEIIRHLTSSSSGSGTGSGVTSGQGYTTDDVAINAAMRAGSGRGSQTGIRSGKAQRGGASAGAQGGSARGSRPKTGGSGKGKGVGGPQDEMKAGATPDPAPAVDDGRLHNLFAASTTPPGAKHPFDGCFNLTSFKNDLLLPHATAEYKKHADSESKALNQGRFYLISVVSFYAAMGIEDHPFYNIVTTGKRGAILMAWKSKSTAKADSELEELPEIYIMERNVCILDISKPLEAFQFATFLMRLREDQEALKKRVQEILDADATGVVAKTKLWQKASQKKLLPAAKAKETNVPAPEAAVEGGPSTGQEETPTTPRLTSLPEVEETTP